jgi:periplasmic protein TonB
MTTVSIVVHAVVLLLVLLIPIVYLTPELPTPPEILAFVAAPPAPPPPPPPPPPRAPVRARTPEPKPVPTTGHLVAPVEAPRSIEPEPPSEPGIEEGVPGGVEGGVAGGIVGGIVGGLVSAPPPPPPPPPPVPKPPPIRVGGRIKAPALVSRVQPEYPLIAQAAHVEGVVILEATVDESGRVESVRVLRSARLLDQAAVEAVKQWRYSPLTLNGHPQSFVLTVTVAFHLGPGLS